MKPPLELTHDELIALAGVLRVMMMADREVSDEESAIATGIGDRLAEIPGDGAAYRGRAMGRRLGSKGWATFWREAITMLPNEAAVRRAVASVKRVEAQEIIYELLYELASAGTIVDPEWDLLEWLDQSW